MSQHPTEGFFKTQTRLTNLMSFRPSSTQSLTHKKLTMAIATKHMKTNKTKYLATAEDPEKMQQEAAKVFALT